MSCLCNMWHKIFQTHNTKYSYIIIQNRIVQTNASKDISSVNCLQKSLKISENEAKCILQACPSIYELPEALIKRNLKSLMRIGLGKNDITNEPTLLNKPVKILHYRKEILNECGIINFNTQILSSYLNIVNTKSIIQLKNAGILPPDIKVKKRLSGFFVESCNGFQADGDCDNEDSQTLVQVRMSILKRYLEKTLNVKDDEFKRGIKTYTRLKSRPFKTIDNTMTLLRDELKVPISKVKSNLSFLHLDPDNIKLFLYRLKTLAGTNIREILLKRPTILNTNYYTILELDAILDTFTITHEARLKCLDIYLLRPETVRQRLTEAKSIPEFNVLFDNPRILSLILYQEKAKRRLLEQSQSNKKCASLHLLLGNTKEYIRYIKNTGDKTKGKDLILGVSQALGQPYSKAVIRASFKKHPFWINTSLVEAKSVFDKLKNQFSSRDILLNCSILLYPWTRIECILSILKGLHQTYAYDYTIQIKKILSFTDLKKLNNAQVLSLILYILEKEYYFSGNGIWTANQESL